MKIRRDQIHGRPEAVWTAEQKALTGKLRRYCPDIPVEVLSDTARRALRFCHFAALNGRDSAFGCAYIMQRYGHDVFERDDAARPIGDASLSEGQRKTMIHYIVSRAG